MFNKNLRLAVQKMNFDNDVTQVASDLNTSKGSVSSYLSGKLKASKPFIRKFANVYGMSYESLIDSDGIEVDEPEHDYTTAPNGKTDKKKKDGELIPFFEIDFAAGNALTMLDNNKATPDYYMDVPEFAGCTAFRAYSDSMERLIKSGSILFGTKVEEWNVHLEFGQIYGIVCNDGRRYLKYIRKFKENPKEYFSLFSENSSYDDFEIPINAIRNIWLIHGWLNRRT